VELVRRGVVAYGKLFSEKAGLVSREWYPDLSNYRYSGYDFDAHYKDGLASYWEKCVMDVLFQEGPTFQGSETAGRFWWRSAERLRYGDDRLANADICYSPQP